MKQERAPAKIYIETTTRCNLCCAMCVKQSEGSGIVEGDFDMNLFNAIESALPYAPHLILNGIGEPLLYPGIEEMIARARHCMPETGSIGFQTNGMILDEATLRRLRAAGLDRVCLSVDAVNDGMFRAVRKGGDFSRMEQAMRVLNRSKEWGDFPLSAGIEFVLSKETMEQMVPAVRWAGERGASFFIVTHLIAYDNATVGNVVYDRNTREAVAIFDEWSERGRREGIDLSGYFSLLCKYLRTPDEERVVRFVEKMTNDAHVKNVFFNLKSLFERDRMIRDTTEAIFEKAKKTAEEFGMELVLPEIIPLGRKHCEFIESGSTFISWRGDVHPCHFLWHRYSCYVTGWRKYVTPRVFGNLADKSLLELWELPEYRDFRETVLRYDYPLCSNCSWAPCDYIYTETFEQDCYANTIPCCDCQWCMGVFKCMG